MRGSIVQRGNSISIVVDLGRDPQTGKRQQKWFSGYKTKKAAEKDLPKILLKAQNGELVKSNSINVTDFFTEWLDNHSKKNDLSPTTINGYENIINNHVIPYFGQRKLQDLKTYDIQKYFDDKFNSGLSAKTLTQHYRVIKKALTYALKMKLIEYDICRDVERPKEKKFEQQILTIEQVTQLLELIKGNWYYEVPVVLGVLVGLRRGEILGLRWTDIDFINKTITIANTQQKVKGEVIFKEPKTAKSKRTIAITDDIIDVLKRHKKAQAQLKLAYDGEWGNDIDLVCTRENGKPITPTVLSTSFKNYLIRNGLPGIRFHDLRHTNATIMLAAGIHVKAAGNRLGHSKSQTTLDIYSHVLQSVDRESAEKIRAVLSR